jgi:hypothetical protein
MSEQKKAFHTTRIADVGVVQGSKLISGGKLKGGMEEGAIPPQAPRRRPRIHSLLDSYPPLMSINSYPPLVTGPEIHVLRRDLASGEATAGITTLEKNFFNLSFPDWRHIARARDMWMDRITDRFFLSRRPSHVGDMFKTWGHDVALEKLGVGTRDRVSILFHLLLGYRSALIEHAIDMQGVREIIEPYEEHGDGNIRERISVLEENTALLSALEGMPAGSFNSTYNIEQRLLRLETCLLMQKPDDSPWYRMSEGPSATQHPHVRPFIRGGLHMTAGLMDDNHQTLFGIGIAELHQSEPGDEKRFWGNVRATLVSMNFPLGVADICCALIGAPTLCLFGAVPWDRSWDVSDFHHQNLYDFHERKWSNSSSRPPALHTQLIRMDTADVNGNRADEDAPKLHSLAEVVDAMYDLGDHERDPDDETLRPPHRFDLRYTSPSTRRWMMRQWGFKLPSHTGEDTILGWLELMEGVTTALYAVKGATRKKVTVQVRWGILTLVMFNRAVRLLESMIQYKHIISTHHSAGPYPSHRDPTLETFEGQPRHKYVCDPYLATSVEKRLAMIEHWIWPIEDLPQEMARRLSLQDKREELSSPYGSSTPSRFSTHDYTIAQRLDRVWLQLTTNLGTSALGERLSEAGIASGISLVNRDRVRTNQSAVELPFYSQPRLAVPTELHWHRGDPLERLFIWPHEEQPRREQPVVTDRRSEQPKRLKTDHVLHKQ